MMLRPQKIRSTHILILALAASDILFSLVIHPMLVATSFGADTVTLFSRRGYDKLLSLVSSLYFLKAAIGMVLELSSLAVSA